MDGWTAQNAIKTNKILTNFSFLSIFTDMDSILQQIVSQNRFYKKSLKKSSPIIVEKSLFPYCH